MNRIFLFRVNPDKDEELFSFLAKQEPGSLSELIREAIKKQYIKNRG